LKSLHDHCYLWSCF